MVEIPLTRALIRNHVGSACGVSSASRTPLMTPGPWE